MQNINYPRPQLKRKSFHSLNGVWRMNDQNVDVPSCLQKNKMHYETSFKYKKTNDRVILHFDAVDQITTVFLNNRFVGLNIGGYLPFEFEITDFIKEGQNILVVDVIDELDKTYPYGKQTSKPSGMWYTQVSGIWGNVWYEEVPSKYIKNIKITPDLKGVDLDIEIDNKGKILKKHKRINIKNPILWTPQKPYLYHELIKESKDIVEIYFALRTISIESIKGINRVCLNGKPIFLNGVLDQGYFKPGLFIALNNAYFKDIKNMKDLGFNLLRKHIKIESEEFYYQCDKQGILVMQDMVSSGEVSFIKDTVLPTLGFNRKDNVESIDSRMKFFIDYSIKTINHLYNHPSVISYTIFNEGWGQFNADDLYIRFKTIDKTRLFDSTSGWFKQNLSDFDSKHVYFRNIKLNIKERPFLLSECGGYVFNVNNEKVRWGYGICHTKSELTNRIIKLYQDMVIPYIPKGLNGVIYTQLSDVEQEINGLYTYDRKICKVDKQKIKTLFNFLKIE